MLEKTSTLFTLKQWLKQGYNYKVWLNYKGKREYPPLFISITVISIFSTCSLTHFDYDAPLNTKKGIKKQWSRNKRDLFSDFTEKTS